MAVSIYALLFVVAIAAAIWRFRTYPGPLIGRLIQAMLPISAGGIVFELWNLMVRGITLDWNEGKLAPIIAMTKGYRLYQDPLTGVMTGWLYGPVGALILLPTALARDPTTAVIFGIAISIICYLAPVAWILYVASGKTIRTITVAAFLYFAWQSVVVENLFRCMAIAAPDASALGLAACGCAAIYTSRRTKNCWLSALAVILCVWDKQNFITIIPGLLIWIAMVDGKKAVLRYFIAILVVGAVVSATLLLTFNASAMWYHMIALPARHPLRGIGESGRLFIGSLGVSDLIVNCSASIGLVVFAMLLDYALSNRGADWRGWLARRPWGMLLVVSACLIPGSLAAYMKVGGFLNSLAPVNFFILLAALLALVHLAVSGILLPQLSHYLACALLIAGLVAEISCLNVEVISSSSKLLLHPWQNSQQDLFQYVRAHPDETYCPWNPLTTLMADGKLYHFEWGLLDRALADAHPDNQQYINHFPQHINKLVYLHTPQNTAAFDLLLNIRRKVEVPELPGSLVYVP